MKKFKGIIAMILFIGIIVSKAQGEDLRILCSIYPVYQITRNVTQGRTDLDVSLMLPAEFGCPHDYALTPHDMVDLARADVLIINGLGMEEFLGAPLKRANPDLTVLDCSSGIKDILSFEECGHSVGAEDREKHHHSHHHGESNPHIFTSPALTGQMAANIAEGLGKIDPKGKEQYERNAAKYRKKMEILSEEMAGMGRTLLNTRIVTQHSIFAYLARDAGLEVVAVVQEDPGQEPSASQVLRILKVIRSAKGGAIFTEPQYSDRICRTIAKEAGIPVTSLDPVATGPDNAPLDHYEAVMKRNINVLRKTLGTKSK